MLPENKATLANCSITASYVSKTNMVRQGLLRPQRSASPSASASILVITDGDLRPTCEGDFQTKFTNNNGLERLELSLSRFAASQPPSCPHRIASSPVFQSCSIYPNRALTSRTVFSSPVFFPMLSLILIAGLPPA